MTKKFLLRKDKKGNKGKALTQKQECGCLSLKLSLSSYTHAFFQPTNTY